MADPSIFEKYPGSYRLDHPDFANVSKITYAKGVITAFYEANGDDPVVAKDVCDLEIDGQEFKEIPIFYHQQKDYIENWKQNVIPAGHYEILSESVAWKEFWEVPGVLLDKNDEVVSQIPPEGIPYDGNRIARGAYSFSVGDEVTVMIKADELIAVLGFADGIPRRPFDYVKVEMPPQILDSDDPENVGDPHCPYILQLSDSARATTPSGPNPGYDSPLGTELGPDGFDLKLLEDAKIFPDKIAYGPPGESEPLAFDYDYICYYSNGFHGSLILDTGLWETPPDPGFGPWYGYMNFGGEYISWADYLDQWLTACDTIQTINPWPGLWPDGLGRPSHWLFTVEDPNDPANQSTTKYVMRTYLIEAGPILYLVRVFYFHLTPPPGGGRVAYWQNRIAWPWDGFNPPIDWSGYSYEDTSNWKPPMWAFGYSGPTPTIIAECVPPPDGYMSGTHSTEYFFTDNPHYIYSAPSSRKILDNIESIIAASNAQVDVHAVQQHSQYAIPPEGFRNIFGNETSYQLPPGFIPPVGNYRELNFKIAARVGT